MVTWTMITLVSGTKVLYRSLLQCWLVLMNSYYQRTLILLPWLENLWSWDWLSACPSSSSSCFSGQFYLRRKYFIHQKISSNFRYVVTVLWRCCFKPKLEAEQNPISSNFHNPTRNYKILSNSQTQTSLLHLHTPTTPVFCSPETTSGRIHIVIKLRLIK